MDISMIKSKAYNDSEYDPIYDSVDNALYTQMYLLYRLHGCGCIGLELCQKITSLILKDFNVIKLRCKYEKNLFSEAQGIYEKMKNEKEIDFNKLDNKMAYNQSEWYQIWQIVNLMYRSSC